MFVIVNVYLYWNIMCGTIVLKKKLLIKSGIEITFEVVRFQKISDTWG